MRDEGRLRRALEAQTTRRFDVTTALAVRGRVDELLETVRLVADDDEFWNMVEAQTRSWSPNQLARVRQLDTAAFSALLEAAGYHNPPPPPVDELVDDTIAALGAAVERAHEPEEAARLIRQARWELRTLTMRVRRQIDPQHEPEIAPARLRSNARALGRAARWLLPRLAATVAGALVEMHAPASGAGYVLGASVQRVAEDLADQVAQMVVGEPVPGAATVESDYAGLDDEPVYDPCVVHLAALADKVNALAVYSSGDSEVGRQHLVAEAADHLRRVEELQQDWLRLADKGPDAERSAERSFEQLTSGLRALTVHTFQGGLRLPGPESLELGQSCVGAVRHLRAVLSTK